MPVTGSEIASLDFANLIGGPLNAIVEAQAKSAITTANFIREVGFDDKGKVIPVEFKYNRKNDDGHDQEFSLKVPFLTMLPVPYIAVNHAVVEFNAKITSVNETEASDSLKTDVSSSVRGRWWFASASVTSKTSYQKQTSSSERAERSFDMHVRVEAKNQEMPAGTERLLELLESAISEKEGDVATVSITLVKKDSGNAKKIIVEGADLEKLNTKIIKIPVTGVATDATISNADEAAKTIELSDEPDDGVLGDTFTIETA